MKRVRSPSPAVAEIEVQILDLLRTKQRLMFPEIANAFPEHTWYTLLSALNRLRQRRQVDLLAHRWDYEILLHNNHPPK